MLRLWTANLILFVLQIATLVFILETPDSLITLLPALKILCSLLAAALLITFVFSIVLEMPLLRPADFIVTLFNWFTICMSRGIAGAILSFNDGDVPMMMSYVFDSFLFLFLLIYGYYKIIKKEKLNTKEVIEGTIVMLPFGVGLIFGLIVLVLTRKNKGKMEA